MNAKFPVSILYAAMAAAGLAYAGSAWAEDATIVGPVTRIELTADGKAASTVLKDGKSGDEVAVTVVDDLTLDKFKDKRIVEGDEIRTRFEKKDGRNISKSFKKTAGC